MDVRFAHVAINCADPLAVERFYARHFGFRRARVIPAGEDSVVFLRSGSVLLELFKTKQSRPMPPPDRAGYSFQGLRHLAFQVDDVDAKLAEMGKDARVTLGPLDFDEFIPGWRTVWVSDPEGNIVELSQGYTDQNPAPDFDGTT